MMLLVFVCLVQLQLMICCVRCLTSGIVALIIPRADVTFLMSLERDICEVSGLVWTKFALKDSFRLVVIHRVFLE